MIQPRVRLLALALAAAFAATPALAQNITTSGITGRVLDAAGKPVAHAKVIIVNVPSGTTSVVSTDAEGRYNAQGLRVGGPYEIKVDAQGQAPAERDNVFLQLGQPASVNLTVGAAATEAKTLAAVTVRASALDEIFSPDDRGLSTTISQRQLNATPQGNRSIDDVARLDPRITVLDQGTGSISAAGMNPRYNNIAVNGVTQGDPFGLNANGLPYLKSPISPDAIAGYNIATANYDVTSDVVGADINAVTKSGTNQFHGSVYFNYRNANALVGRAGWLPSSNPGYKYNGYDKDSTYGLTLGGPILKDKLFFFIAAEHEKTTGIGADSVNGLDYGLGDGPSTGTKVSPGDLQKVIDIAKQLGLTPGGFGGSSALTYDDKRLLGKLDWNISNNHRATFTYQRVHELQPSVGGNGPTSVGLSSYTWVKDITTDNYVAQLFDNWSDNFSTEARLSLQKFVQDTTTPYKQPAVNVNLSPTGNGPSVNLGTERYRHYNHIDTKQVRLFLAGTYYLGDHAIKGGVDYQRNKINNLFGQTEFGQYNFWGLSNFAAGQYSSYLLFHPAPGYTLDDIAGRWTYVQYSPFIQDTWQVNDALSLQYGLRVDIPQTEGRPVYNAAFSQAFGIANNTVLGPGNKVVEPRASFNYQFDTALKTQLRGGLGLFQSTPPIVWLTNPFQNNGVTLLQYYATNPAAVPFSPDPYQQNIPAGGGAGSVDTLAPDFKLPTVWKFSLAVDRELPWWNLVASAEYEHIKVKDGIRYEAINFGAPTGTLPDGRQQFWCTPGEAPSAKDILCKRNPAFSYQSTYLANTHKGKSDTLTLSLTKPFEHGFSGMFSVTLANATDVDPGTDTIAFSGYSRVARVNPNTDVAATSNYDIAKSVKLALNWEHRFFGDYRTMVSLFYNGHSGLPYTWVFGNDANGDSISGWDPVYIPTVSDPKVSYGNASAQVIAQFQSFLASDKYLRDHRGQIASRNGARAPWATALDMSFAQEIPGLFKGNKGTIRLDIYNFLNLLDKKWGLQQYTGVYPTRILANYGGVNAQGQYVYVLPTDKSGNYAPQALSYYDGGFYDPSRVVSRWSAMVTLNYSF